MPSANKTPNYELNQWQGNEYPKRQDFVDDNAKIDAALKENADTAADSIPKSLATAANQFLVSSGVGTFVVKTVAQIKTLLGLGSAAYTNTTAYATAAQGTTADNTASDLVTHTAEKASTSVSGHVQLQNTVDNSESKALTPKALYNHLTDLTNHIADLVTDADGVHGIREYSGTFTPTLISSGGTSAHTYNYQRGFYHRIGNLVKCDIDIELLAKDTGGTGLLFIGGLPFTSKAAANKKISGTIGVFSRMNFDSGYTSFHVILAESSNVLYLMQCAKLIVIDYAHPGCLQNNSGIALSIEYEI